MALKLHYYGSALLSVESFGLVRRKFWRWWLLETYQVSCDAAFGLMRTEAKSSSNTGLDTSLTSFEHGDFALC